MRARGLLICATATLGVAVGTASVVPTHAAAGSGATVVLKDISFMKMTTTIKAGQTVTWKWEDGPYTPHNVTSTGKLKFKNASTRKTGSYTVRFTKKGTYTYECTIHPGMTGKIVVK